MVVLAHLANAHRWFERRYVPDAGRNDVDVHRSWSLVVHLGAIYTVAAWFFVVVYIPLGLWIPAVSALVPALVGTFIMWGPRHRLEIRTHGRLLVASAFIAFVGGSLGTGALSSAALAWFPLASVIGFIVAGKREGVLAMVGGMLFYMALYGLYLAGLNPMPAFSDPMMKSLFAFLMPAGALMCTGAVVWSYEVGRQRAVHRVEELRRGTRRLLDSVNDGLVVVGMAGLLNPERSSAAERLIPGLRNAETLWSAIGRHDSKAASWIELGWEDLAEAGMPYEVVLAQLPAQITVEERILKVTYNPIFEVGHLTSVLVVFADITAKIAAARAQEARQDTLAVFMVRIEHPVEFGSFLSEVRSLIRKLHVGGDLISERRWIHTLKGCVATFGLSAFATNIHEIEDAIEEIGECPVGLRHELVSRWAILEEALAPILGDSHTSVSVERSDLDQLIKRARAGMLPALVAEVLERWTWQDVGSRLDQLAERGSRVAARLGKSHVQFVVEGQCIVLPPSEFNSGFWAALVHVVRNAVDHGVELEDERAACGKNRSAEIRLSSWVSGRSLFVSVSDDGRGIQWDALRERAISLGLPCETEEELVELLFQDGVSTVDLVSETSGRGLGMAALMEEVLLCNGRVTVESTLGEGSRFIFELPVERSHAQLMAS